MPLGSKLFHDFDVVDFKRDGRCHHLAPAIAFRIFAEGGSGFGGEGVGLLLRVVGAYRLGGIAELGVVCADFHSGDEGNDLAVGAVTAHNPLHACLYHIGYGTLGFAAAEVHGHGGQAAELFAGVVPEQAVAHLGAVAVSDNYIPAVFNKGPELLAGVFHVGKLLGIRALLAAAQECVAAEGYHCQFLFHSLSLLRGRVEQRSRPPILLISR